MRSAEKRRALSTTRGRSRAAQENFSFLFFPFSGFVGAETEDITTFLRAPIEGNSFRGFFNFPFWFPKRALNKRMCLRESERGPQFLGTEKKPKDTKSKLSFRFIPIQFPLPPVNPILVLVAILPFYSGFCSPPSAELSRKALGEPDPSSSWKQGAELLFRFERNHREAPPHTHTLSPALSYFSTLSN